MKCLNIESPEFITLYNKTTVHPLKLLMMVNKYFSENREAEEMPTFKQLGLTAKDLKQSVTKVDEHLLSLEQDGFISYKNNEIEYKGTIYSKKGFLKTMYGLSVSDNAEGSINPVAYFSVRKGTANNLLTALDGYISTQEELNQYFKTYVDNSPNVFDAIRNNDAFVEYVKGIIGEQKEKEQKVTSFNKNPNPVNISAKFPKDQTKADYADSMIGFGEPNTSTAKYAARFGDKSNKGVYQKGETVFISVNGRGRANLESNLAKTKAEIDKAISQGVGRFVADNKDVANSSHNSVGEGVIRQYLLDKGMLYVEYDGIGFYVNNLQQQDSVKPVIDLSREWSGDLESSPVYTKGSVNTMRTKSAKPNEHFGNPWSKGGYSGTIETSSVAKAVQNYKDWLTTDKYDFDHPLKMMDDFEFNKFYTQIKKMSNSNNNIVQEQFANNYLLNLLNRKRWILDQINQGKLDGANLLYSKKLMDRGQGSHAIALAEVVEQLRSQQQKLEPYNIDQALANSQRLFQELIDVAFKDLFNTPESIDNYRVYYDVEVEGLGDVRKERKLKPTDKIKLIVDENGAEYYAIELDQPDAIDKLIGGIGYTDILLKVANDKRIYVDVAPIVLDRMDKLFLDKKGLELVGYDDFVGKIYDIYGDNEGNGQDVVKAIGEKIPEFNRIVNQVYEDEDLDFNDLRKEYSNIIIGQVWKRLANEGITNADSLIGTRETINNKDFNKFWSAVKDVDIQNAINFFESEKQKALNAFDKYKGGFDPTTGTFTSDDTSFFDKKIKDLETLLQQNQQPQPQQKQPQQKQTKEFTYKNKTIETSFVLTQGQENALKRLVDFSKDRNGEKMITLQGAAGTGKTSVIGYLQKYLGSDYNFVYMAPTHAATAELAFATVPIGNTQLPMTVASAMKETKLKDGTKKIVPSKKLKGKLDFVDNIIVIDESSMLGKKNYDSLVELLQGINAKIIFMGDIKQIPEVDVRNPKQKEVSDAFVKPEQVILTEVKRTESNSILSVLTSLRNNMDSKIPIVENSDELNFLKQNEYDKELVKTVKEDPEDTVVISYTNSSVQSYNKKIRKVLGREGNLKPGDIITGYIGYASKELEKGHIANSVRFKVDAVSKIGSVYRITAVSKKMSQLKKMGLKIPAWYNGNYFQLSLNDSFVFDDITSDDMKKNNDQISNLMKRLYEEKEYAKKSNRWKSFEELKKEVSDFFAVNLLGENYIYNPSTGEMELFNYSSHQNIKKQYPELYVEKSVDFGHAITIHKSQGSSIKNVFFDTDSLPEREGSVLVQGGNVVGNEKHSLIYVAMSRASKKLFVNLTNPAHFKRIKQPAQQPQQQQQQPVTESKKPMSFGELMQLPQVNNRVNLYLKENPNMTVNEIINKLIIDGIINKDCTI